ncbi:Protein FAM179B [Pitangus sulphuratus]|nr:Protein FAM179B [Pitangus sulphuratus]
MGAAGPRAVLRLLLQERLLRHRSARLREELLNTCTAALLTYPGEQLDLPRLAAALAPALLDSKRRVRHAALEALAALAAAMGAGRTQELLGAVGAAELRAGGAGALLALQARLARKALPRLGEQGRVEYALPLPSAGRCRGRCHPPGADTEWLLMGSGTQSARCGCPAGQEALRGPGSACAGQAVSPRRVLSAGRGKNKLPWESELAGDREGGSAVRMPFPKGVEQSSVEVNSGNSSVCAGAMDSQQPQNPGKHGTLGYPQARGKDGSVDSELQFWGLNNCQQDKVSSSLNFSSKTQRGFCTQAEPTMSFQGLSASQGTFILPSCPLSSPRNSPKHLSSPAASPGKAQDRPTSLSNSWPRKSFEGLPQPGSQKQLLSQKPGDSTGEKVLDKPPLQLKARAVRAPPGRRGLPVPPIPGGTGHRDSEDSQGSCLGQRGRELAAGLARLHLDAEEVDQQEMQNSLRSLRNSAAKKRAQLSSSFADLESPDPAAKLDLSGDCPSQGSSPSESGIYSQDSLPSPVPTLPRRRVMSDTFPLLGSKCHPAKASPVRSRAPAVAEHHSSTGLAESVSGFAPMDDLGFLPGDTVVVVGKGVFGSPPARAHSQSMPCVANGDDRGVREDTEPSPGTLGRSLQQNSASHFHAENDRQIKVTMSKSAQDKLRRKRKEEKKELNHKEHQEGKDLEGKEEIPWEGLRLSMSEPERLTAESEDEDEPCLAPRGRPKEQGPAVTPSPEVLDPSELQPFPRPDTALAEALALLADDDWYYGRRMLFSMMAHPEFEKALEKHIPAKDLPYIRESVSSLREKGLGEMPLDTPSAKGRRSQTGSVGHLRSSPTSRDALSVPDRDSTEAREVPRKAAPRSALESEEYVKDIVGLLNAKDFRERITGIRQLLLDTENSPGLVVANLVKIFDAFKSRLHDSNSKVNQVALETMHKMIPLLKDSLSPVINMLIPAIVDNNLNSKNPGIYAAATNVIQALCQHLELVLELYPRKPHAVEQKVLPVLWPLLGNTSSSGAGAGGSLRTATARLAKALFAQMGPGLLAHAAAQPAPVRKALEELLETGM